MLWIQSCYFYQQLGSNVGLRLGVVNEASFLVKMFPQIFQTSFFFEERNCVKISGCENVSYSQLRMILVAVG